MAWAWSLNPHVRRKDWIPSPPTCLLTSIHVIALFQTSTNIYIQKHINKIQFFKAELSIVLKKWTPVAASVLVMCFAPPPSVFTVTHCAKCHMGYKGTHLASRPCSWRTCWLAAAIREWVLETGPAKALWLSRIQSLKQVTVERLNWPALHFPLSAQLHSTCLRFCCQAEMMHRPFPLCFLCQQGNCCDFTWKVCGWGRGEQTDVSIPCMPPKRRGRD